MQCVVAAAREVSEGESEARRERAGLIGWTKSRARANSRRPYTKPTGVKLTPVGWEPGRWLSPVGNPKSRRELILPTEVVYFPVVHAGFDGLGLKTITALFGLAEARIRLKP